MSGKLGECAYGEREPLKIEQDPWRGTVTINGTAFSYEMFDYLGQNDLGIGQTIRINKKENGNVEVTRFKSCPNCGLDLDAAVID